MLLLTVALILAACCLRSPITGVGSLTKMIQQELLLSKASAGMLTTIPLLAFAGISIVVGRISTKIGAGRVMLGSLILMAIGILLRSANQVTLFIGTILIGIGIAFENVLIPAIIKAFYPSKIGLMTSVYTTTMAIFSGIAGGISVPLAIRYGWRKSLSFWIFLVLIATFLWIFERNRRIIPERNENEPNNHKERGLKTFLGNSMTWYISLYMGIQSFIFFCFVAWLSAILQDNGFTVKTAGYYVSAFVLLGIPGSFLVPILASRRKSQSALGVGLGIIYCIGIIALLFGSYHPSLIVAIICCGFCSGGCISFPMALFGLHTKDASDAGTLSGIAQSIGYLIAAIGPAMLGSMYDVTGGWGIPLVLLLIMAASLILLGYLAGRNKIIE